MTKPTQPPRAAQKPIAETFLASQGYALFERVGESQFRVIGAYPAWCARVWGEAPHASAAGSARGAAPKALRLGERSPFLENFFLEAESVWSGAGEESVRSGDWVECATDGAEIPLEAAAWRLAGKSILVLQNLSSTYAEQQRLFQTARDSLLEHERLVREVQKKEILLHCIVHDLTQPLGAMRGAFDLLAGERLPERTARFVEIARGESLRQEQMIRGILEAFSADLAAEQAAKGAESPGANILECARQAVRDFSAAFEAHGLRLRLDTSLVAGPDAALDARAERDSNWYVAGDAPRILRIFGNLLENAQRYTPRGKAVTIGVEDKGSHVLAYVDDEGQGLPPDAAKGGAAAAKLFALFTKGKDRPGKAGLGLYFCKITVERWGGAIGAENRAQGGSRFWFRLPRAAAAQAVARISVKEKTIASQALAVDALSVHDGHKSRGKKPSSAEAAHPLRILIAEDSEANRELLMEMLKKRGHSVAGVEDGREALAAIARENFDALLMDEEMPRMNGLDAARAIRKSEDAGKKRLAIIAVTGNATGEDEKRFLEAGMDGFLPKPVSMDKLFEMVESVARAAAGSQSSAPPPAAAHASAHESASTAASATGAATAQSHEIVSDAAPESVVAHLRRTTGGNEPLMRSLAKTFLADAPARFAALRRAIAKKDADGVAKTAHLLKGGLSIFGALRAVDGARRLESMGRAADLRDAAAAFSALEEEFASLRKELEALQAPAPRPKSKSKPKPRRAARSRKTR
ncbi:MAG TPA: response regulator [Candidatus Acidoferrales bacterium]|nr:response regulator [Candidatus Acidoferrales bacterium]